MTTGREIISECYGYSFQVPRSWRIYPNPVPLISTGTPQQVRGDSLTPMGVADISFVPEDETAHSIAGATEWDRKSAHTGSFAARPLQLATAWGCARLL